MFEDMAKFFDIDHLGECAPSASGSDKLHINSCVLENSDCSGALISTKLSIDTESPWSIFMDIDHNTGYTENYCIRCTNEGNEKEEMKN